MPYPRFQKSRGHKFITKTDGNFSVTATSKAVGSTITGVSDISLAASVGDTVMVSLNGLWLNEAPQGNLAVVTVVAGAIVSSFPGSGWIGLPTSAYVGFGGSVMHTLVSGDISSGVVTVRALAWVGSASRTLSANGGEPLQFWAINLGPADPN